MSEIDHYEFLPPSPRREVPTWSFATYVRIRPPDFGTDVSATLAPTSRGRQTGTIDYAHRRVNIGDQGSTDTNSLTASSPPSSPPSSSSSSKLRSILELDIPPDADPGLVHNNESGRLRYEFDKVYDVDATQEFLFDEVARSKVIDAIDGINSTVFAYGQTGTGKTFTIIGGETYQERGIIPRALNVAFEEIRKRKEEDPTALFKVHISFTEIYKEAVYDLLDTNKSSMPIEQWTAVQVMDSENGLVLKNVNVFEVTTEEDALSLFFMGNANRITSSTAMNNVSSRSHAIFTLIFEQEKIKDGRSVIFSGKVNFVDLAGSERMYKMVNSKGQIVEAKSINLSLHFLEQVILSLRNKWGSNDKEKGKGKGKKEKEKEKDAAIHVPYRNSVLTNMLRDSLGGNCRSCFILTLSLEKIHFEETVSTCRFGQRCGEIKVQVHANAEVGLKDQVKELTMRLKSAEKHIYALEDQNKRMSSTLESEKSLRATMCSARLLTQEEKAMCKSCVHNLLSAAKASLEYTTEKLNQHKKLDSSPSGGSSSSSTGVNGSAILTPEEIEKGAEALLDKSQEVFGDAVEKMDKAVLVELCSALGGLVQSMYIEREKMKEKERLDAEVNSHMRAMEVANAKAESDQAEAQRLKNDNNSPRRNGLNRIISQADKQMLIAGAMFYKQGRLGMRQMRYIYISSDLTTMYWRPTKDSNPDGQSSILISSFDCVEIDRSERKAKSRESCLITLRSGKSGGRSMFIEYGGYPTLEENRLAAVKWADALAVLVDNPQAVPSSLVEPASSPDAALKLAKAAPALSVDNLFN